MLTPCQQVMACSGTVLLMQSTLCRRMLPYGGNGHSQDLPLDLTTLNSKCAFQLIVLFRIRIFRRPRGMSQTFCAREQVIKACCVNELVTNMNVRYALLHNQFINAVNVYQYKPKPDQLMRSSV